MISAWEEEIMNAWWKNYVQQLARDTEIRYETMAQQQTIEAVQLLPMSGAFKRRLFSNTNNGRSFFACWSVNKQVKEKQVACRCQRCYYETKWANVDTRRVASSGSRGPGIQREHLQTVASVLLNRGTWTTYLRQRKQDCLQSMSHKAWRRAETKSNVMYKFNYHVCTHSYIGKIGTIGRWSMGN